MPMSKLQKKEKERKVRRLRLLCEVLFAEGSKASCISSTRTWNQLTQTQDIETGIFAKTHLSFAIRPKVDGDADKVVYRWVGRLIHERRGEGRERQDDEAELEGAVDARAGDKGEWPLEGEHSDAEEEVYDLQDWDGLYCAVEVLGEEVPKDFGPEEAFYGGSYLVYREIVCQ